ncbi:hypothetical protein JHK87_038425 [Glycine soja]|nr:hypothetical protein JHK87_038425 [Glycine soja]
MDEAQQKEQVLKEEMKDCEAALSSLREEKKKFIAETIGYKNELENVRKMVEDQSKVRQELFELGFLLFLFHIELETPIVFCPGEKYSKPKVPKLQ